MANKPYTEDELFQNGSWSGEERVKPDLDPARLRLLLAKLKGAKAQNDKMSSNWNKAKLYAEMKKMEHERDEAFAEANSAREAMKREYHRRKEAEVKVVSMRKVLIDIADDYEDRFDLTSPSTNPGIKTVIENARKVLSSDAPTPTVPVEHKCDECEDGSWFDGSHGCSRTCKKCKGTGILKEKP